MNVGNMDVNEFVELIRDIVRQEIKKTGLEYSYFGKIKTVNNDGTFDVEIPSDGGIYPSLLNKSGEELSVGNSVVIKAKNKNFGNAYIAIKNGA